jgi:5-formyltetrahydrofolate cyclo-ligase
MKPEMRRKLAQLPFEQKIRKVAEMIQLSRKLNVQRISETADDAADVAYLTRARSKEMHYRPLKDYSRERKERA